MLGLAIELRTECRHCGQPLPINAFAERITCRACHRATEIDEELWTSLLEDAVQDFNNLDVDEGQTSTIMTGGSTWALMYGRQLPRCGSCKATFPEQALQFAERGWAICVACGKRFGIRPASPLMAKFGAVALVNEDPAQIPGAQAADAMPVPAARNPVVFSCPKCAGALTIDGKNRLVRCQYCSTDVYLPDDLWQRLHPVATVSRWYAWFTESGQRAAFRWSSIHHAVMGADHQLYCVGTNDDDDLVVWCMGLDFAARWLCKKPPVRAGWSSDVRLTIDTMGRVFVWAEGQHAAALVSAVDGSVLGTLGEKERAGVTAHGFDLNDAKQLHADVDGTLLALVDERLVRYAPDGSPLATWPVRAGVFGAKAEKLRPLYSDGSVHSVGDAKIEEVKDHPLGLRSGTKLCLGRDGRLYAEYDAFAACFDRAGKLVYRVKVPETKQLASDGYGQLYVLARENDRHMLLRVAPDGSRIDVVATHRKQGGTLGAEDVLVVGADGTCFLLGYGRSVRVIAPDGRLLYQSDQSHKSDAEADEDDD